MKKVFKRKLALSVLEKNKKWQYGLEWYKSLSEDEKQRLVKYEKNIAKYGKIKTI